MDAKNKAQELVKEYWALMPIISSFDDIGVAKQCALIAVGEIIKSSPTSPFEIKDPCPDDWFECGEEALKYWIEVEQEIQKL